MARIKWKNAAETLVVIGGIALGCMAAVHGFYSEPVDNYNYKKSTTEVFTEYEVPKEYQEEGGKLDARTQRRVWYACQMYGVSYPMILAMIEAETGYKNDSVSSAGAVGYMQIIPEWHKGRMKRLHADVNNPVDNIVIGIDYIAELQKHCSNEHYLLMSYNMGLSEATKMWERGIYTTEYSEYIVKREKEISDSLENQNLFLK